MEPKYVFIDESGDPNLNEKASSHFIISAVIVTKSNLYDFNNNLKIIKNKHFQKGEMKSSKIAKNHKRRVKILEEIKSLEFNSIVLIIDKNKIHRNSGLTYKQVFYKFFHDKLYSELRKAFPDIIVVADAFGSTEFQTAFKKYVYDKTNPSLIDNFYFRFEDSEETLGIQLADIISGTLSFHYEITKTKSNNRPDFKKIIKNRIRIEYFPRNNYSFENEYEFNNEYDKLIAETSLRQANRVITELEKSNSDNGDEYVIIAKYLRYKLMHFDKEGFIPTFELQEHLQKTLGKKYSEQGFRGIVAHLKDRDMLISSTTRGGYKLPSSLADIDSFINIGNNQVIPMINRIKKCRKLISTVTDNKVDILDKSKYSTLKNILDNDVV